MAALAACLGAFLQGASCARNMNKPAQGIYGTFLTYGPPKEQADCTPFKTQFEKDECRHANERVIEEPLQAVIKIRNLQTGAVESVALDPQGSYRVSVDPGEYAVCVQGECSDPMTVRLNAYVTYGQRLPRTVEAPADTVQRKPAKAVP